LATRVSKTRQVGKYESANFENQKRSLDWA